MEKAEARAHAAEARVEAALEKPWPTVSGSVNWTSPAILAPATPQPESAPEPEPKPADMRPPQRRRGPPTTHDWHSIDGEIARRCIDPKTGRVQVPKSESKLANEVLGWLAENEQGQPSVSEMREAVKRVCAALRPAQK